MKRKSVNKHKARKAFNNSVSKTKLINVLPKPLRGGIRL